MLAKFLLNDFYLLNGLSLFSLLIIPTYFIARSKMAKSAFVGDPPPSYYSKQRITKIATLNFLLVFLSLTYITILMFSIKMHSSDWLLFSTTDVLLFILFFLFCCLICYGAGMYIISIIKEQFTTKSLETHPEYKILFLTNLYFHGPISHVLIFSGGFMLFLLMALLEIAHPINAVPNFYAYFYVINGVIFGVLILASQILNQTWKHQFPWMFTIYTLYLVILGSGVIEFEVMPFNLFFTIFGFVLSFGLLSKHIIYLVRKQIYRYDDQLINIKNMIGLTKGATNK
jgi:hypothetical protein